MEDDGGAIYEFSVERCACLRMENRTRPCVEEPQPASNHPAKRRRSYVAQLLQSMQFDSGDSPKKIKRVEVIHGLNNVSHDLGFYKLQYVYYVWSPQLNNLLIRFGQVNSDVLLMNKAEYFIMRARVQGGLQILQRRII